MRQQQENNVNGRQRGTWETLKAFLVLSVCFSLLAALLLVCIRSGTELDSFLMLTVLLLLGGQRGIQLTAEEIYTHNSSDKGL